MEGNNITLDELIDTGWLEAVRERARQRLLESVVSKEIDDATVGDIHTPYGQMVECLSFLYAMVTVCASFDDRLLGRWAEGEAGRAEKLWGNIEKDKSKFQQLAETYLSDVQMNADGNWEVSMIDFIEICPKISGPYWRLPNRPTKNGWVVLSPGAKGSSQKQLCRLLKERIRAQIIEDCRVRREKIDDAFTGRMAEEVGRMVSLLQKQASTEVSFTSADEGDWPPCMQEITTQLAQSVNINHVGRVFLASMSRVIGLTVDQAQAFFVNAPDYSADTTRYQLNHVFEHEYTPAGCPKLQINACCPVSRGDVKSNLCSLDWMDHPLKYLRARQRSKHREEQQKAPAPSE